MQVFIRHTNTLTFELFHMNTIADVKHKYFERTGIPPVHLIFTHNGKSLKDNELITKYNITNNSTIYMNIRMPA